MPRRIALHVLLLALAGVGVVTVLALLVVADATAAVDQAIIGVVRSSELGEVLTPLRPITELGSTMTVTLVGVATVAVGVAIGPWIHGLIGAAVIAIASVGNGALKILIARERPDLLEPILVERGFSFPSGHAALAMVAWGILGVLISRSRIAPAVRRAIIAALAVIVFLVGLSRVWLGVHYPSDVLAGWIAGFTVVLVYAEVTRAVSREPAEAAVDADPAGPRSDPPAGG